MAMMATTTIIMVTTTSSTTQTVAMETPERRTPDPQAAMGRHHHRSPLRPRLLPSYREVYRYPLAHLEIEAVEPAKSPLPMTETSFRSHFYAPTDIDAEGGPVDFVRAWLDHVARSQEWKAVQN